jgi:hypothetical protein
MVFSICAFIAYIITYYVCSSLNAALNEGYEEFKLNKRLIKQSKSMMIISSITLFFSTLVCVFTPSTKQAYIIFGVGTTVEYVINNDEMKQIPDNAAKAINKWLEEINNEEEMSEVDESE